MKRILLLFSMAFLLFQHYESYSQKMPFQGRLLENGVPVNATLPIDFSVTGTTWTESHASVNVENGLYSVVLGSVNPLPADLFNGVDERSLNITVNGTALTPVTIYHAITKPLGTEVSSGLVFNDSISIIDGDNRKGLVLKSSQGAYKNGIINGFGSNGKSNFQLLGLGNGLNYGSLLLDDAAGTTKAFLGVNQNVPEFPDASGTFSLYGAGSGRAGIGFSSGDLPYIALEGSAKNQNRVWIDIYKDPETGVESGTINISSSDGKLLHLDPSTQLGIPSRGPTTENFLMTGKDWEGKGDYPLFELRGTINSAADGTGYTLPLAGINTNDDGIREWGNFFLTSGAIGGNTINTRLKLDIYKDGNGNETGAIIINSSNGKELVIDANTQFGIPAMGPTTENFLMTGKDWEGKGDYPIFELKGTINSMADGTGYTLPLSSLNTHDDGIHEWGSFNIFSGGIGSNEITRMVGMEVTKNGNGINGQMVLHGQHSENVVIGAANWETGGTERGNISILGNSLRPDGSGGSYNPALINMHVRHDGTEEVGNIRLENEAGNVTLDINASENGIVVLRNGAGGEVAIFGNGDIGASGNITATTVTNTSDRRYKEDITALKSPLQNTLKLRGVSYFWKDKNKSARRQIGLIAQEVEAVYPEFVHTDSVGYKSVNYSSMVAVLIEAVKELENRVQTLEKENSSLIGENASLKASLGTEMEVIHQRMNQLESLLNLPPQNASAAQAAIEGSDK